MNKMSAKIWVLFTLLLFLGAIPDAPAGTVNYTYDNAGRLIKADYGGGKSIDFTYDNAGNLLTRIVATPPLVVSSSVLRHTVSMRTASRLPLPSPVRVGRMERSQSSMPRVTGQRQQGLIIRHLLAPSIGRMGTVQPRPLMYRSWMTS